jgi:hypothetical protein
MQRIDERIAATFGDAGLPEELDREQFASLAGLSEGELSTMIATGNVRTVPGGNRIPAIEYHRLACAKNLRESGASEEAIAHVLESLR